MAGEPASAAEVAAMRRALELAQSAGVPLAPNPRVGCVLLDASGVAIGEGFHRGAGTPHAEVDSLADAGESARGTTVVVTLEPCDHTGRTGACSAALIDAGVVRVVYAQPDPNPVAAGGATRLRAAGIDVIGGVLAGEAEQVNPVWSFAMRAGRPFVTWKFAASLDGRSSAADGSSRWISSAAARDDVHRLRAACDAIAVGTGTVLADDPKLTVRPGGRPLPRQAQPLRVVIGCSPLPVTARVLDDAAETIVLRTRDLDAVLGELSGRERRHVWLEGGPKLAGAFLAAEVVDEVVAYVAPVLLGAGTNALGDVGISTVRDAVRLDVHDVAQVGSDLRITASPRRARPGEG